MAYVEENLLDGEEIRYRARLHRKILVAPLVAVTLGVILIVPPIARFTHVLPPLGFEHEDEILLGLLGLGGLLLLFGVLALITRSIRYRTSEFAVTSRRVLVKVGFLRRYTVELWLGKIEGISVDQPVLGRILDYGTIVITGTGGTREIFRDIADPLELRRRVQASVPG